MNALLALIKQSVLTDSNVSMMRLGGYLVSAVLLALFSVQVAAGIVTNIIAGRPITVMDLPAVSASLIGGVFLAKGLQAFSKGDSDVPK